MKKSSIMRIVFFVLVFIAGCLIGIFAASYEYYKVVFSYYAANTQAELYRQILIVSHLHLKEPNEAIALLDADIDKKIVDISSPVYAYNTEYRDYVLKVAKTYRELYPPYSVYADKVDEILTPIPKLETFKSENSLFHLVQQDLRKTKNPAEPNDLQINNRSDTEWYETRYLSGLTSKILTEREQAAETIRNDRKELIKGLQELASENVKPLQPSNPQFPVEYPWHDSKHLSITLLGDLHVTEAISILIDNLEYRNPKSIVSLEPQDTGGWYPSAEALSKIGIKAVDPVINKLTIYEPNSIGSKNCCWILKKILGEKLARYCLQLTIEETKDETAKKNLTAVLPYFKTAKEKADEEYSQRKNTTS
jgi:hypothetical protein